MYGENAVQVYRLEEINKQNSKEPYEVQILKEKEQIKKIVS